jgi:hypothetical protein
MPYLNCVPRVSYPGGGGRLRLLKQQRTEITYRYFRYPDRDRGAVAAFLHVRAGEFVVHLLDYLMLQRQAMRSSSPEAPFLPSPSLSLAQRRVWG